MRSKSTTRLLRSLAGFDVMTHVLSSLGVRSRLFCRANCAAPWTLAVEPSEFTHFHILEQGVAWLVVEGHRNPIAIALGDVLVIAPRQRYQIVDLPGRKESPTTVFTDRDIPQRPIALKHGGGGPKTLLVCGSFLFEFGDGHPILSLLPKVMHIKATSATSKASLRSVVKSLIAEVTTMNPGAETVISRLADILFVHVLREWLAQQPARPSWLAALNDRRIAPALSLIHASPQHSWTVRQLASKVGLSRSPFSVRFGRVVGESPHAYITRVRMLRAARMLKEADVPIADVALSAGFESESSFNKAFKRYYGRTPGQFRRTEPEPTPPSARLRVPSHDGRAITRRSGGGATAARNER
jgi:AraC-like DNA-binding protein